MGSDSTAMSPKVAAMNSATARRLVRPTFSERGGSSPDGRGSNGFDSGWGGPSVASRGLLCVAFPSQSGGGQDSDNPSAIRG
jgi:hypothetical protein